MFQTMDSQRLPIVHSQLVRGLIRLGLEAGDMVMVHSSMRAVGKVLGGPDVVIRALSDVVGAGGTVVMYVDW
jgi:aminoglycoside 3-N-acetyltransferase